MILILWLLFISIGINLLFFFIAFIIKKDLFTDITYASTFLITNLIVFLWKDLFRIEAILMFALIACWSLRLGTFLFIRIWKLKVDHRFDKMRNSFWKFGAFWMTQAITVWLISLPSYFLLINNNSQFEIYSWLFFGLALLFLLFETVADFQKFYFKQAHKKDFISIGLWKISRHPNYFGEIMFWWFLTIFSLVNSWEWINLAFLISPIYITALLYFFSGVPILEKNAWKRYGKDPNYLVYLNKTPCVIPLLGKKGVYHKKK